MSRMHWNWLVVFWIHWKMLGFSKVYIIYWNWQIVFWLLLNALKHWFCNGLACIASQVIRVFRILQNKLQVAHCICTVTGCGTVGWYCDHDKCTAGDWFCYVFDCIPIQFVCDGYGDCLDGTDEDLDNCPTSICIFHSWSQLHSLRKKCNPDSMYSTLKLHDIFIWSILLWHFNMFSLSLWMLYFFCSFHISLSKAL